MGAERLGIPEVELFSVPSEAKEGELLSRYALAFDGHGLQFQGMGREFLEQYPEVDRYYQLAQEVLEYDLKDLCLNGSKEQLNQTEFAQPAIIVYNLAAYHVLRKTLPEQMAISPEFISYQSLGMLNAIHRAGMLGDPESDESIKSLIHLAQVRGKIMQEASDDIDGGMWLLSGAKKGQDPSRKTKKSFPKAVGFYERAGIFPAIERNEVQMVVSGLVNDFDAIQGQIGDRLKKRFGIVAVRLPGACGPFHSPHMTNAARKFEQTLTNWRFDSAKIPIQSNSSPVRILSEEEDIKKELINGFTGRVYGREMIGHLHDNDIPVFEVGEKMLIGDTLMFDNRYEAARKISFGTIAKVGGIAAAATAATGAVAYLLIKRKN